MSRVKGIVLWSIFVAAAAGLAVWVLVAVREGEEGAARMVKEPRGENSVSSEDVIGTLVEDSVVIEEDVIDGEVREDLGGMVELDEGREGSDAGDGGVKMALPPELEFGELDGALLRGQMRAIWMRQDGVIAGRPVYEEVKAGLIGEIFERGLEEVSTEELVELANEHIGRFWEEGGCFSSTSYKNGYIARAVLEYALEREPGNLGVIDGLAEVIQSVNPLARFNGESGELEAEVETVTLIGGLRGRQFELIKGEEQVGRKPDVQDFVRVSDMVYLLQESDREKAKAGVDWLMTRADAGGWGCYRELLNRMAQSLNSEERLSFNVYSTGGRVEENLRYTRRSPSFQGPASRELILGLPPKHVFMTTEKETGF